MRFYILLSILFLHTIMLSAPDTVHEYSFKTLTKAQAPYEIKIIPHIVRNKSTETGILFTYDSRGSKSVLIAGDFSQWTPRPMIKGTNGIWYYFLSEYTSEAALRYKFLVDGIWISDPENPEAIDDGSGSFLSIAYPASSPEDKTVTYRFIRKNGIDYVEFRTYNREASYISIAGDFNNWNPENNPLVKDENNIWRTKINLPEGKYRYKFIIDGNWSPDIYNSDTAYDGMGGIASLIVVSPVTKRDIIILN